MEKISINFRGTLEAWELKNYKGHSNWVTAVATTENPNVLITGSRDKSLIVWNLTREEGEFGTAARSYRGHNHFISDIAISSNGLYVLTASWDKTLRLWDLATGKTVTIFKGHTNDVLSVSFSADDRQIASGSRDRTIKLWNTIGECKFEFNRDCHSDWVSSVCFSPNSANPVIVSGGWDKIVKVWDLAIFKLKTNHIGHTGPIHTVTVSPDGSLCASGGKDGVTMLWDLNEGKHLYSLEGKDSINALIFSPNRFWLCEATSTSIQIWDLETKSKQAELKPEFTGIGEKSVTPECISLAWSYDGSTLFAGYTDNKVRVWEVSA